MSNSLPVPAAPAATSEHEPSKRTEPIVPVVCIGMSAGGVDALKTIVKRLSPTTGMAFVIVSHLHPGYKTQLPELLSSWSKMPAELVQHGLVLRPNHLYLLPAGQEAAVRDGYFSIRPKSKTRGLSNVITLFLESLTKHRKPPGIAVILSGLDSDGASALEAFAGAGGLVISQEPRSAQFRDMPRAAIDTGVVDYVLMPEEIPGRLEILARSLNSGSSENETA